MSENHASSELIVVFHIFFFIVCACLSNQVGQKLGLKLPILLLYLVGMLMGFYYIQYPDQRIVVLGYLGRNVLRTAYTPVYFFTGIFDLELEFIQFRAFQYTVACVLMWVSTVVSVMFAYTTMFSHIDHDWYGGILMAIIVMIPDIKTTKHFIEASNSFTSKQIFILLELECLIGSIGASIAHDLYLFDFSADSSFDYLAYFVRNAISCIFAFIVGKFTTGSISHMHFDQTNQITTIFVAIFFTYAAVASTDSSGDLAVMAFGLVLLGAKPGMAPETVTNISRFIETFRHGLVGSILIIGGILFTMSDYTSAALTFLSLNIAIYLIVISCRFVVMGGFWVIFGRFYQLTTVTTFTMCAFNIKSVFNVVLALSLIVNIDHFTPETNQLFVIANFQFFLSIIITTPIISFMFSTEGQQAATAQTVEMVQKAMARINECKEMTMRVLKGIQFTVDADWSKVVHTTSIEKVLIRRFNHKANGTKSLVTLEQAPEVMDDTELRTEAIHDLLRLQKRFFEEQFRHGTLGGPSAKRFAHFLRACMHNVKFLSSQIVIDSTGPYTAMQITIRDLIGTLCVRGRSSKCWSAVISVFFLIDVSLNIFSVISKLFMFSRVNQYVPALHMGYSIFLTALGVLSVLRTGTFYLHTISYSLWNWLAWALTLSSAGAFCLDALVMNVNDPLESCYRLLSPNFHINLKVYYLLILVTAVVTLCRSIVLACYLYPVQNILFRITTSMLHTSVFNQCDACQGFLQAMIDTHQRLENRSLDKNFEVGAADILHMQSLAMRQFIGVMEILTPNVMTAVRTRLACRLVLMSQEKIIHDLDENGELESKELGRLTDMVRAKLRNIHALRKNLAEPCYLDVIKNIPWVDMTKLSAQAIMDLGVVQMFKPGDVLIAQGNMVTGLIVILKGLVRVEILSKNNDLFNKKAPKYRKSRYVIRNTDNSKKDEVELADFYTRGNVIGEFPFLIGRPGHKSYRCVTEVTALYLSAEEMNEFMGNARNVMEPMNTLEHNMWMTVGIRQAARLVQWSASYHLLTRRQLYSMLENSFLMDSISIKELENEDLKRAVIVLVYGEMTCPATGGHYVGPAIIPSNLLQLHLKRPSSVNIDLGKTRNVIMVLRSFKSMRMFMTLKSSMNEPTANADNDSSVTDKLSLMTMSSGSSDGIPYRHKHVAFK